MKIAVLGDSISLAYRRFFTRCVVVNAPFNAGDSEQLLMAIEQSNFATPIIWNAGLHDVRRERHTLTRQQTDESYERQLRAIVQQFAHVPHYFVTTTPIDDEHHNAREEGCFRFNEDVVRLNEIARRMMEQYRVPVLDLYEWTTRQTGELYDDHVHFTSEIAERQAKWLEQQLIGDE